MDALGRTSFNQGIRGIAALCSSKAEQLARKGWFWLVFHEIDMVPFWYRRKAVDYTALEEQLKQEEAGKLSTARKEVEKLPVDKISPGSN